MSLLRNSYFPSVHLRIYMMMFVVCRLCLFHKDLWYLYHLCMNIFSSSSSQHLMSTGNIFLFSFLYLLCITQYKFPFEYYITRKTINRTDIFWWHLFKLTLLVFWSNVYIFWRRQKQRHDEYDEYDEYDEDKDNEVFLAFKIMKLEKSCFQ